MLLRFRVISRPEMLALEYELGHQISVHTWSHPRESSLPIPLETTMQDPEELIASRFVPSFFSSYHHDQRTGKLYPTISDSKKMF